MKPLGTCCTAAEHYTLVSTATYGVNQPTLYSHLLMAEHHPDMVMAEDWERVMFEFCPFCGKKLKVIDSEPEA